MNIKKRIKEGVYEDAKWIEPTHYMTEAWLDISQLPCHYDAKNVTVITSTFLVHFGF